MQYLPDVPAHRTSTGLNNRKLAMWAFLGSDVLFFGTLIGTHMIYRGQGAGPHEEVFDIPLTTVSTFVLLMSSLAMVLALAGFQQGKLGAGRFWLAATAILGMVFIGFQMYEFTYFAIHDHLTPRTNLFGSTFLVMTGFHGTHVAVGVFWLWSLFFNTFDQKLGPITFKPRIGQHNSLEVELAGLYWHFVDIVWIVIFGVVYLVGAFGVEAVAH